uniref:G protein-coupled receptor 68 n=2 Tax=Latimeria chalumnae TaxID=7897 RepID=H3BI48_LATCH
SGVATNSLNCTINHGIRQTLFPVVYILVFVVGLPANLISLYYGYLQIKAKNDLGIYLCNLTIADLLYIFSLPFWLQYVLQHDDWTYSEIFCKICGVLLYENIYVSIAFLCCISVERYIAVVYPFRFHALRSMKASILVSTFIWIVELGTCWNFFQHTVIAKDHDNDKLCFEYYPIKAWEDNINYYRLCAGFLFPIFLLTFSYCRILVTVKKSVGTREHQKERIKKLVLVTVLIFLVCFTPYHILTTVRSIFEKDCEFAQGIFGYYHVSLLLTSFNCVADPLLYCFASENTYKDFVKFKKCILRLFCCTREKTHEAISATKDQLATSPLETVAVLLNKDS